MVAMLPWPSVDCTSGSEAPQSIACESCAWRSQCGDIASLMPAFLAVSLTMPLTARSVRWPPLRLANTGSLVEDLTKAPPHPLFDMHLKAGVQALLAVPLLHQDDVIGALVVRRMRVGIFGSEIVSLLQTFASQSAIAIQNARLFEEIARKSRELEIASQHKSQFVANMSHELRTPLAAILGYAELMQEGFYEPLGQKSMDALTRIRSNGKHLLGLINTVLDIAKIESGQFSLNLGEYALENVVETVRHWPKPRSSPSRPMLPSPCRSASATNNA